jgi:hypothetical protein
LGFSLNTTAISYLKSSAKWEKFLAWVNIILLSIGILLCLFGGSIILKGLSNGRSGSFDSYGDGMLTFVMIFYAIILAVVLIPNFYRLIFANKCIKAIDNSDEEMLTDSLRNLKIYSTFWGILTIIFVAIYILMFIGILATLSSIR